MTVECSRCKGTGLNQRVSKYREKIIESYMFCNGVGFIILTEDAPNKVR